MSGSYSGLPAQFVPFQDFAANGTGTGLDALMDEVGIWNRALTTSEINDSYNNANDETMINSGLATPFTAVSSNARRPR